MCCSKREERDDRRTRKRTSAGRDRGDTTVVEDVCAERIWSPLLTVLRDKGRESVPTLFCSVLARAHGFVDRSKIR